MLQIDPTTNLPSSLYVYKKSDNKWYYRMADETESEGFETEEACQIEFELYLEWLG